jgi:protein TonB
MHALEPDPEQKNRWRRLLTGGAVAVGLAGGMLFAAQKVVPVQRLMPEILQMAVVDDLTPPPKQDIPPPPPPPPPPPKPKAKEEPKEKPVEQEAPPEERAAEAEPSEAAAGLDASSFGAGSGSGFAFRTGNTQMGDPNKLIRKPLAITPPRPLSKAPKLMPARALDPVLPEYPERARKLNIQGAVLLEAEIDDHGKLIGLRVRQGLERGLDEIALASVRSWRFQPASLGGRSVASTRLVRIRFELD